jgi:hypothetical protein
MNANLQKYLKYKLKYLDLKNELEGGAPGDKKKAAEELLAYINDSNNPTNATNYPEINRLIKKYNKMPGVSDDHDLEVIINDNVEKTEEVDDLKKRLNTLISTSLENDVDKPFLNGSEDLSTLIGKKTGVNDRCNDLLNAIFAQINNSLGIDDQYAIIDTINDIKEQVFNLTNNLSAAHQQAQQAQADLATAQADLTKVQRRLIISQQESEQKQKIIDTYINKKSQGQQSGPGQGQPGNTPQQPRQQPGQNPGLPPEIRKSTGL